MSVAADDRTVLSPGPQRAPQETAAGPERRRHDIVGGPVAGEGHQCGQPVRIDQKRHAPNRVPLAQAQRADQHGIRREVGRLCRVDVRLRDGRRGPQPLPLGRADAVGEEVRHVVGIVPLEAERAAGALASGAALLEHERLAVEPPLIVREAARRPGRFDQGRERLGGRSVEDRDQRVREPQAVLEPADGCLGGPGRGNSSLGRHVGSSWDGSGITARARCATGSPAGCRD